MITFWNQLGSQWQTLMVPLLFQGSLAIVVVWATGSCWPKLPASKRHWLWRLAYIKLLVLVCWQSPLKLPVLPPPTTPIPIINPTHAAMASPSLQRSDFLPRTAPRNLELATSETKLAPKKEVAGKPTQPRRHPGNSLALRRRRLSWPSHYPLVENKTSPQRRTNPGSHSASRSVRGDVSRTQYSLGSTTSQSF